MPEVLAYACDDTTSTFHKTTVTLREPGPGEIYFDVKYAGICHSDGITTYSPLTRYGAGPGKKVAVVGIGGLGHMGV